MRILLTGVIIIWGINAYSQQVSVQDLKLVDVSTREEIVFSDYKSKTALVVIFFCNNCPYSTYYTDRIRDLYMAYNDFQFLLINSSNSEFAPEESEANMADFLKRNKLEIPYLIDKDKKALKNLNAKRCPEVFVLTPKDWKTAYSGAIDDNPQVADDVSDFHLKKVLEQLRKGASVAVTNVRPTGCIIK